MKVYIILDESNDLGVGSFVEKVFSNKEKAIDKLQIEVVDLKEKLRKSENEVERLGRLVDSLTREIDRMERSNYSDDDDY